MCEISLSQRVWYNVLRAASKQAYKRQSRVYNLRKLFMRYDFVLFFCKTYSDTLNYVEKQTGEHEIRKNIFSDV